MQYDVIIVGAGPAGSTAAKYLAEHQKSVLLLDKHWFPRDKACGGGLPTRLLKKVPYLSTDHLIDSYLYGGTFYSPSLKYRVHIEKKEPLVAMVLRKHFDHELVNLAKQAGAIISDDTKVVDISITDTHVTVYTESNKPLQSSIVIGADGVFSTVAKSTRLRPSSEPFALSVYEEYVLGEQTLDEYYTKERLGHLHFSFQGIHGYGWVFPKKQSINIGVVDMLPRKAQKTTAPNLKQVYLSYVELLQQQHLLPSSVQPQKIQGSALPVRPLEKTYTDRVMVCGDAAGFINPFTGEGIDFAITSGALAAQTAVDALEKNDTSARFLSRYETAWKKEFGKDIYMFLRLISRGGIDNEKFVKLLRSDRQIAELLVDIGLGNISVRECKARIIQRYLIYKIKQLLRIHRKKQ